MPSQKPNPAKKKQEELAREIAYDFLAQIHVQMEAKNMKQKDLAKALGTTEAYVSKVFSSARNLTVTSMIQWANAVELTPTVVTYENLDCVDEVDKYISPHVFRCCWEKCEKPLSMAEIEDTFSTIH